MLKEYRVFDVRAWPEVVSRVLGEPPGDVVFDLDGTLLRGDLGEAVFRRLVRSGHVPRAVRARFGADPQAGYVEAVRTRPAEFHSIGCAQVLAGLTLPDVAALAETCFATGDVAPRPPVVALARALGAAGHRPWIVTGTASVLARCAAPKLGFDPRRVIGMKLAQEHGRLTDRIVPPATVGSGKVEATRDRLGGAHLFAIGDTLPDLPLLRAASLGAVAVPAGEGEFARQARSAGIPVRLPADLETFGKTLPSGAFRIYSKAAGR